MSRTLNLVDHLLARGRRLHHFGQLRAATRTLRKLSTFESLPANDTEEIHAELAELRLAQQQFAKARRHLSVLLAQAPDHAGYHYQMARAVEQDKEGEPASALEHYRRALELDPDQPQWLCDFGLLAIAVGDDEEEGITALRRAAQLAPDDPEVLAKVADGLAQADHDEEAARLLGAAQFRNIKDGRFKQLLSNFRFQQLLREQEASQARYTIDDEEEQPTILRFPAPSVNGEELAPAPKRIRRDRPTPVQPPHFPRPARMPRRKHA
jgi:tetratricopeptide (TPR) repeat protein